MPVDPLPFSPGLKDPRPALRDYLEDARRHAAQRAAPRHAEARELAETIAAAAQGCLDAIARGAILDAVAWALGLVELVALEDVPFQKARKGGQAPAGTGWVNDVVHRLLDRHGDRSAAFLWGRLPKKRVPENDPAWCGAFDKGGEAHPDGGGRPVGFDAFRSHVYAAKRARKQIPEK